MTSERLIELWQAVTWSNIPRASQVEIGWRIYLEHSERAGADHPAHTRRDLPPVYKQRAREWHSQRRGKFLKANANHET